MVQTGTRPTSNTLRGLALLAITALNKGTAFTKKDGKRGCHQFPRAWRDIHRPHITGNLVILAAHITNGGAAQLAPMLSVPVFMVVRAIVSTEGFLGIGSHDVAVPAAQFKRWFHRAVM
jgi:hypothetical protein